MRYIAFLRSINVGGHTVKMDRLCQLFESLNLSNVETFIASGNVAFDSASKNGKALEKKIEAQLKTALGYEATTFVRTVAEVAAIAKYKPFGKPKAGNGLYIAFVAEPPDKAANRKLMAHKTQTDDFYVHKREIYWLCRTRFSESEFSGPSLEKTLGMRATVRNVNTVEKIAAACAPGKK